MQYKLNSLQRAKFREMVTSKVLPARKAELNALIRVRDSVQRLVEIVEKFLGDDARQSELYGLHTKELREANLMIDLLTSESLSNFDFEHLDDKQFEEYFDFVNEFEESNNSFVLIKAFVWSVRNELSPPAWMLNVLAEIFENHIENPDPAALAAQFKLVGSKQGTSRAIDQHKRRNSQKAAVYDVLILISKFGMSKTNAAKAAIAKHELDVKPKTLINIYNKEFKSLFEALPISEPMSEYIRTHYVQSFPVAVRGLLAK